jgi:ACR3 family arsenite efflux pump ArsB
LRPAHTGAIRYAGLNYTIAAFATLVLGFSARFERVRSRAVWLLAAAALALAATPLVNAARIALDLTLRAQALPSWLSAADVHRLEGVAIYLASLFCLYAATERAFAPRAERWRAVAIPLAAYLAVALLVPALNGAAANAGFPRHAAAVLGAALALTALRLLAAGVGRRYPRRRAYAYSSTSWPSL